MLTGVKPGSGLGCYLVGLGNGLVNGWVCYCIYFGFSLDPDLVLVDVNHKD